MHTTLLRKVGGSVMLSVPPAILDVLHLHAGSAVGLEVQDGRLVVASQPKPVYTLEQLLSECQPAAEEQDRDWLNLPPVGLEL